MKVCYHGTSSLGVGASMRFRLVLCIFLLTGCARSSVMDLDSNTIQISTSAAPVCGQAGAQEVVTKQAAIETIRRGFDKYMIVGGGYENDVRVVGHTPYVANSYYSGT